MYGMYKTRQLSCNVYKKNHFTKLQVTY